MTVHGAELGAGEVYKLDPHMMLGEDMSLFMDDPLSFVMYAFPWRTDPSIQVCPMPEPWRSQFNSDWGPDEWACAFLDRIGIEVRKRGFKAAMGAVEPLRMAVASGHGIGKSAMVAWLTIWIMSTRPGSQGTITANTMTQLETKTWARIAFWLKKSATREWFRITTGRGAMKMVSYSDPDNWFCSGQTCREENSEAFAGQHAPTATSFYIFDEASAVPDAIWEVAQGGLTDGEPMWYAFGNPTRNTGRFRECWRQQRKRWITYQIDSRDCHITNKGQLDEWIEDYGVDSDFVKIRVRGIFPSQSAYQLISEEYVDRAWDKELKPTQYEFAPGIIGVDPAWTGDDELCIVYRRGLYSEVLATMPRNDDDIGVANMVARFQDELGVAVVNIDAGYGTGIYSAGKAMGREWNLIWFSAKATKPGFANKRAEMWCDMRDWLKNGGAIPPDHVLRLDLVGPEVIPQTDGKIKLESKEDMKKKGMPSPNRGDGLALTFATDVVIDDWLGAAAETESEYDPV